MGISETSGTRVQTNSREFKLMFNQTNSFGARAAKLSVAAARDYEIHHIKTAVLNREPEAETINVHHTASRV